MQLNNSHYKKIELIPGWLDFPNAQLLYELASNPKLIGQGDILEIGAFFGKSAACLGYGLKDNERLTVIDSFGTIQFDSNSDVESINQNIFYRDLTEKKFRNFYAFAHKKPANVVVGLSSDILPKLSEKFKLVHIDGGHSYQDVKIDIINTLKLLTQKSMIVFDDYGHIDYPGVKKAVNEAIQSAIIVPIVYLGKLYATTPEFATELIENMEMNLSGFKVIRNSKQGIFEPKLELFSIFVEPKKYSYTIKRIITAFLSRI
jgi:predicted O-methyltransferase YrrM